MAPQSGTMEQGRKTARVEIGLGFGLARARQRERASERRVSAWRIDEVSFERHACNTVIHDGLEFGNTLAVNATYIAMNM